MKKILEMLLRIFLILVLAALLGFLFLQQFLQRTHKWTPGGSLHQALYLDDLSLAKQLLKKDPTLVNRVNSREQFPISYAKSKEAVDLLMSYGADVNIGCNMRIITPLMGVIWTDLSLAKYYISKGAKIDCKSVEGQTALHDSAKRNMLESVKLLVESGANVNAIDNEGNTPLHIAAGGYLARLDPLEAVEYLVKNGAKIDLLNNAGQTALDLAIIRDNTKVIDFLKNNGALPGK
jgi:ankyrin repeat protein